MNLDRTPPFSLGRAAWDNLTYFGSGRWLRATNAEPVQECPVPRDFLGIAVAGNPDPAADDFILGRLQELDLRQVRLDFTYASPGTFQERLLRRLLAESFRVCLHLAPPMEDARLLSDKPSACRAPAEARWQSFVAQTLNAYGTKVEYVEIGSTTNRRKWSGFTPAGYFRCWQIACAASSDRSVRLIAPNVTDFEPVYNLAFLGNMRRQGLRPDVHTDNLFVERATEPETYDHKILGRRLAGLLRFNLIRKAQLLQDIGRRDGVPDLFCTHVSWSLRRIARLLEAVEEKQADYLARYCLLAAASGALRRVYWGPLIGQREGLIDDGTTEFPDIPHVAFYGEARGRVADYRVRPAFHALRAVNRFLAGVTFRRKIPTGPGLEILEFASGDRLIHAVWTGNGQRTLRRDCYTSDQLSGAAAYTRDGQPASQVPDTFSESPLYLVWQPSDIRPGLLAGLRQKPAPIPGVRFAHGPGSTYRPFGNPVWKGFYWTPDKGPAIDEKVLPALVFDSAPSKIHHSAPTSRDDGGGPLAANGKIPNVVLLRDRRNRVWSVPAPWDSAQILVIKQFKPRGNWRRQLDHGKPGKARRSWNGAQELIRRGILTPQPIAFLESTEPAAGGAGVYICRSFSPCWSARDALTALRLGQTEFEGFAAQQIYEALAGFLIRLHNRGVYFRDLSAGNLLCRRKPDATLELALIDTARARFYPQAVNLRQRLCDLMRLCHPLDWDQRHVLAGLYLAALGGSFRWWMQIPFHYYDWKHRTKNAVKRWRQTR